MKNKKIIKLLTLVLTFVFLAALALNVAADTSHNAYSIGPNVPDRSINRRDADSSVADNNNDNSTSNTDNATSNQTGAVDEALKDASEAVSDAKDTVKDAIDDTAGSKIMGVVIAILIAVAVIILIIVMVSKNNGKYNRK